MENPKEVQLVRVIDVDISFKQMVELFVKAALAVIPALLILAVFAVVLLGMLRWFVLVLGLGA